MGNAFPMGLSQHAQVVIEQSGSGGIVGEKLLERLPETIVFLRFFELMRTCLLYTSDAADE